MKIKAVGDKLETHIKYTSYFFSGKMIYPEVFKK